MKKVILKNICLILMIWLTFSIDQSHAATLKATIPKSTISINKITVSNEKLKTPFLFYKNVYYLPVSKELSNVLGIQFVSGQNDRFGDQANVIYIGTGKVNPETLALETINKKNEATAAVSIANGYIFLNSTDEYSENAKEKYPVLLFKNTYYLPLTWHISKELMNWDMKSKNGQLKIDSTQSVRPILDGSAILNTSIGAGINNKGYLFNDSAYLTYPKSTMNNQYIFSYKIRGSNEIAINLQSQLSDGDYYFNVLVNNKGEITSDSQHLSKLENGLLVICCVKIYIKDDQTIRENQLIQIDLSTQKIIGVKKLP